MPATQWSKTEPKRSFPASSIRSFHVRSKRGKVARSSQTPRRRGRISILMNRRTTTLTMAQAFSTAPWSDPSSATRASASSSLLRAGSRILNSMSPPSSLTPLPSRVPASSPACFHRYTSLNITLVVPRNMKTLNEKKR